MRADNTFVCSWHLMDGENDWSQYKMLNIEETELAKGEVLNFRFRLQVKGKLWIFTFKERGNRVLSKNME